MRERHIENNIITSSAKKNNHYQNNSKKYSDFYKRKLREKINNPFKGTAEEKLKALNLAEELADKSTLHILKRGLKVGDLEIVGLSASLIEKFKKNSVINFSLNFSNPINWSVLTFVISSN